MTKALCIGAALWLSVAAALAEPVAGVEIWITPTGKGGGGGTAIDPFSTPDADSFFDLIHGQRKVDGTNFVIPENSTIHLMPGVFEVRDGFVADKCPRTCLTVKHGWKVQGAGMYATTLRAVRLPAKLAPNGTIVIAGSGGVCNNWEWPVDNVEVSDLTVDCNLQAQKAVKVMSAINLSGSNNRIRRLRAINWGSKDEHECFVVATVAHYQPRTGGYHGGVIEECLVEQPAPVRHVNGSSAICVGGGIPPSGGWVIRHCTVRDITSVNGGGTGKPAYMNAFIGVGHDAEISHCQAINLTGDGGMGVYNDTAPMVNVFIHDNMFLNVGTGINLNHLVSDATNVVIQNNLIAFNPGRYGINLSARKGLVMRGMRVEGNTVFPGAPGGSGGPLSVTGDIEFSADNNVFESGPGTFPDCAFGAGALARSFANNRNQRGTRLTLNRPGLIPDLNGSYSENFSFTPQTNGWHKVLLMRGFASVRFNLWSDGPYPADLELTFVHRDDEPDRDEINQLHNGSRYEDAAIPRVRLARYRAFARNEDPTFAASSFDIYVAGAMVGQKVNVRISGMLRPSNFVKDLVPYPAPQPPAISHELVIGPGIRSTGGIHPIPEPTPSK